MRVLDVGLKRAPKSYPAAQLWPFRLTYPSTFCGFKPSESQNAGEMPACAPWIRQIEPRSRLLLSVALRYSAFAPPPMESQSVSFTASDGLKLNVWSCEKRAL